MNSQFLRARDPKSSVCKASRFISLSPCGLSDGMGESLTGYLARLADAHGLATWGLVVREFAPRFCRPLVDKEGHSDLFGPFGAALNGLGRTALQAVKILGSLTGGEGLELLTLLPFRDVLSSRSSVRKTVAWCPLCLSHWLCTGRPVYLPLVWQLDVVLVCPMHTDCSLENICPRCRQTHFQLCRNSIPGHCPKCGAWLGIENFKQPRHQAKVRDLDRSIAKQTNDLIRSSAAASSTHSERLFRRNLRLILNQSFNGGITAFSRAVGMHHNSLSELVFETTRSGLDSLLRLALATRIEAVKLVGEAISQNDLVLNTATHPGLEFFERRTCRKYDWPTISRTLRRELKQSQRFPNSLFSLCRQHELDSGYVALRLNESADVLIKRYQNAASGRRQKREHAEKQDLRKTVRLCLEQQIWPSNRKLRSLVKSPGSLRSPKLEQERRRAVAEELRSRSQKRIVTESAAGICTKNAGL